jgi:hypothetical protein
MYHIQKLHCWKQTLAKDKRPKKGIKPHMLSHFTDSILLYGPPCLWDTIKTEKSHGGVKDAFEGTSKRFGTANEEMLVKVSNVRIYRSLMKDFVEKEVEDPKMRNSSHSYYKTEAGIEYESSSSGVMSREILQVGQDFVCKYSQDCTFVSPHMPPNIFKAQLLAYISYLKENRETERCGGKCK